MRYTHAATATAFLLFGVLCLNSLADVERQNVQDTLQRGLTKFRTQGMTHRQQNDYACFELNKLEVALSYRYNVTLEVKGGRSVTLEVMDDPKWMPLLLPSGDDSINSLLNQIEPPRGVYGEGGSADAMTSLTYPISSAIVGPLQIPPFMIRGPAEITLREARRDILFSLPRPVDAGAGPVQKIILQEGVEARLSGVHSVSLHHPTPINLALPSGTKDDVAIDLGAKLMIIVDSLSEVLVSEKAKLQRMEFKGKPGRTVTIVKAPAKRNPNETGRQILSSSGDIEATVKPASSGHEIILDKSKVGALEGIIRSQLQVLPQQFVVDWIQRAEIKMTRLFRLPAKEHAIYDPVSQSFIKEIIISESRDQGVEVLPIPSAEAPMRDYPTSLLPVVTVGNKNVTLLQTDPGWYPHLSPVIQYPN